MDLPPRDPRAVLFARLEKAPEEHAEALLSALDVLQGLHDRGVLELFRGALGSSDKVLEIAVDVAKSPESIRNIRTSFMPRAWFAGNQLTAGRPGTAGAALTVETIIKTSGSTRRTRT